MPPEQERCCACSDPDHCRTARETERHRDRKPAEPAGQDVPDDQAGPAEAEQTGRAGRSAGRRLGIAGRSIPTAWDARSTGCPDGVCTWEAAARLSPGLLLRWLLGARRAMPTGANTRCAAHGTAGVEGLGAKVHPINCCGTNRQANFCGPSTLDGPCAILISQRNRPVRGWVQGSQPRRA
jgi:hypothetical protein